MKISYNWLKNYVNTSLSPQQIADLLTSCGLEVESLENFQSFKGGLQGLVIGEVKTKEKHPDADRLNITKVDIGKELLTIVCGASNVEAGQKVIVATAGTVLYPSTGEPFEIKTSKIRGQLSEGMICAEDEIGLGASHEGIMVLNADVPTGTFAKEYFEVEEDFVFEIGLTPNRADAASHIGVARDIAAVINAIRERNTTGEAKNNLTLQLPSVEKFRVDNTDKKIEVSVEDAAACLRYSGVTISNVKVKESPVWLKNRLKAIGLKPINNLVDITNFVLHETGQPLHAFDADKIKGNKVIVKKLPEGNRFKTLYEVERKLSAKDLMICDAEEAMCIAGVFGGIKSGVSVATTSIFIESACFNPVSIRKTSRLHGLKTDASFRFERGTDPNITIYALKRAAMLIKEIAGGLVSSEIADIYPNPIGDFKVDLLYKNCDRLIGKTIDRNIIKNILSSIEIEILKENTDGLSLAVPPFKVDVQREVDVIEEILRIYGYNNIETPGAVRSSLSHSQKPDKEKIQNVISDLLSNNGFAEIMSNSLTRSEYIKSLETIKSENNVKILNPLSADLDVLRQTLLFGGLEAIAYNQNRKNADLKLYEFGKVYQALQNSNLVLPYEETQHLALFICGRKQPEIWNALNDEVSFFYLKGFVQSILSRLGIRETDCNEITNDIFVDGLSYRVNNKKIVDFGLVNKSVLKSFDIPQKIFYADFNWQHVTELSGRNNIQYLEVSKFPSVRRDLALLIDKQVKFSDIEHLAYQTEKQLLKTVNLFDVYEGNKLEAGKKSYAVSFILQDEEKTLTDKQIDKVMEKLQKTFEMKFGAKLR